MTRVRVLLDVLAVFERENLVDFEIEVDKVSSCLVHVQLTDIDAGQQLFLWTKTYEFLTALLLSESDSNFAAKISFHGQEKKLY